MRPAYDPLAAVCATLGLVLGLSAASQVRAQRAAPPAASEQLTAPTPDDTPDDTPEDTPEDTPAPDDPSTTADAHASADTGADATITRDAPTSSDAGAVPLREPEGPPLTPPGYGDAQPHTNYATPSIYGPATTTGQNLPHYVPGPVPTRPPAPEVLRNMITVDPIAAIQGLVILSYHRALGERVSFYLGPELLIPGVLVDGLKGGGASLGLSVHLLRSAPTGLWFGPRFEILFVNDGTDHGLGILAGAMAGYSWQWGHFTLSLGAGASYAHVEINGYAVLDAVIPTGRTALGIAF